MSGVETHEVAAEEADLRLDRWFKRRFPGVTHGRLERLLRTGQVRVDGARVKAGARLSPGQRVRVPPLGEAPPARTPVRPPVSAADAKRLCDAVLYRDDGIIAIDKPAGLAVQGGSGTHRHIDAMLDALRFDAAERPRLVHRLDRDTSGVLVLARSAAVAARLSAAFRGREVRKLYWALVVGRPERDHGRIALALAKTPGARGERVSGGKTGKPAETSYRVVDTVGDRAAWLALAPRTGRTHQLRVHCVALGTPIAGDGKYGGAGAFLQGVGIARKLHLHARAIVLPRPGRPDLRIVAPLPGHMRETWQTLGFDADADAGSPVGWDSK